MQVKKFEAKTMKEALELVKVHLGPEAIILSAKDSHRGFGLMGEKSVEVTAAVSEETLRKKKIAESRLREDLRERFQKIPAAKQREFIDKAFKGRQMAEQRELVMAEGADLPARRTTASLRATPTVSREARSQVNGMRYIDITDEEAKGAAEDRVRRAAERARAASREILQDPPPRRTTPNPAATASAPVPTAANVNVRALESQVAELKALVERFQKMPQISTSLHPGAEQGLPFELSPVYQRLTGQGMDVAMVSRILKKAQKELDSESIKKPALVESWLVGQLLNTIEVTAQPTAGRYHVFLGSTGQGKTTSLVKFASHLVMKERKTIAIISLDTVKVGAADQLRIYAQILNVPFAIVRTPEEWQMAQQKLAHVQHILVDCPGYNLRSMDEADWLKRMIPPAELDRKIHYVQSVLARDEEAMDLASRYMMIGFHDVIFTRIDESSRQGLILNFQARFQKPIHSFGLGSKIPEDFEFASKERVIDFLFKLSKRPTREEQV